MGLPTLFIIMMIKILILLILVVLTFGQTEVIKVPDDLSGEVKTRLWPSFNNGSIYIDSSVVIYPNGTELLIQKRKSKSTYTKINLKRYSKDRFTVSQVVANKELYAYSVFGGDGRVYLFQMRKKTGEIQGPEIRHGMSSERLFFMGDGSLVATGIYRPQLVDYVNRYRKDSIAEQKRNNKEKFDNLYLDHKAYTISLYDKQLSEFDSGNVIERIGDDARAYEMLFPAHPCDMKDNDILYLIDNDQGYVIEKYTRIKKLDSKIQISNPDFRSIPQEMTYREGVMLRNENRQYSIAYCLYLKEGHILTGFYQAPVMYESIKPPYYYDVVGEDGSTIKSDSLDYPFITEDDGDKIFIYVKEAGGWFQDDDHYLVGVTVQELLDGRITNAWVEAQIQSFVVR